MKIAVVYNSPDACVIQHRGPISQENYPPENIERIVEALKFLGNKVVAMEVDLHLADRLEKFFDTVPNGEWPGLVFNLAFGIQGRLRYCHVPGMLEMLGVPYLGSGPLGQALASDKAAAKVIFRHHGLPTPDFVVIHSSVFSEPGFDYPMIVKPVAEASSLGVHLVHGEKELRAAVQDNLVRFWTPVLVEAYVSGREINVSIIGNQTAQALPPVEVVVGEEGPPIYTYEDKEGTADRELHLLCPAPLHKILSVKVCQIALKAFAVLSCEDWARVEMRIDDEGLPQLLEVNTIPGIGDFSSLPIAAKQAGMEDLHMILKRLVDVAVERYQQQSFKVQME